MKTNAGCRKPAFFYIGRIANFVTLKYARAIGALSKARRCNESIDCMQ